MEWLSSRTFRARARRGCREEGVVVRTRRGHAAVHRAPAARAAAAAHVGEVGKRPRARPDS